jgi:hypothetical protein
MTAAVESSVVGARSNAPVRGGDARRFGAGRRALGAALAAGISLAISIILAGLAGTDALRGLVDQSLLALVALGAALGVPIGGMLGWWHAPVAASSHGHSRPLLVARLATWAVLLGAPLVAVALAFGTNTRPDVDLSTPAGAVGLLSASIGEIAAYAVLALTFGLILFGLPAWVLAAAVSALWVSTIGAVLRDAPLPEASAVPVPEQERALRSDPAAPRVLGWISVGASLAIALALTWLRARGDEPPGMLAAGLLGFFAVFAGPGLVAAVGLVRRRPELLVAAAIVLVCLAPLSMGGATLPLLAPAVILLYVARRMPTRGQHAFKLRVATAVVTISLLATAPLALFTTTEIVCWDDYGGGSVVVWIVPEMPNEQSSVAPFGSGCSSGSISALGGSLAVLAVIGAVIVAVGSGRRPSTEWVARS